MRRWAVVAAIAATLIGAGSLFVVQNTECGGDGGSPRARPGSAQGGYCEGPLPYGALVLPALAVAAGAAAAGRSRRRGPLYAACVVAFVMAVSPLLVTAVLSEA